MNYNRELADKEYQEDMQIEAHANLQQQNRRLKNQVAELWRRIEVLERNAEKK